MIELPPMERVRWLDVLNTTAEQIPAFAPMRVTDMDATTRLIKVGKANADGAGLYLFNGPQPIAANGKGLGTRSFPAVAYYDSGDGTPANGETWGPGNASWKLRKDETGYKVYGLVVSGSFMMVEPQDLSGGSSTFSGARVYNSSNISVSNDTETDLTFDSERFDTDSYHSTSSNTGRLTVPSAGYYLVGGHVRFATNGTGSFRQVWPTLNAGNAIAIHDGTPFSGTQTDVSVCAIWSCSAGDYFTLRVRQDSGGSLNVEATGNHSPEFWIQKIG